MNDTQNPENVAAAYRLLQGELLNLDDKLVVHVAAFSDSQKAQSDREGELMQDSNRTTLVSLWMVTLLGAFFGSLVLGLLVRDISNIADSLAERANSIASGDLTGDPLDLPGGDQLGLVAVAMNRMQGSLSTIIGTVADTAGSLTGSAVSMRSASDQIHRRIDQQSQQTQQAATAMQEMSASIAEVSRPHPVRRGNRSQRRPDRTRRRLHRPPDARLHAEIATAVSETSTTVGLLGDDSKRISQIVTVIDEIARKTNLLALNAAIEAARAGDRAGDSPSSPVKCGALQSPPPRPPAKSPP